MARKYYRTWPLIFSVVFILVVPFYTSEFRASYAVKLLIRVILLNRDAT